MLPVTIKSGQDSYLTYGAKRTRTADPLNAIEVLYQLSHSPIVRYL